MPTPPRLRSLRGLVFVGSTLLLMAALLELGSQVLLSLDAGHWVSGPELTGRLADRVGFEAAEAPGEAGEELWEESLLGDQQVLHPFLGTVVDPTDHWASSFPRASKLSLELGFPLNVHDPLAPRSPERLAVGVFGGSAAAIFGAHRKHFEAALGEQPVFADRKIEVLSFAIAGYKQPQSLMALQWILSLGAELDFVVLLDGFNEVALAPTTNLPLGYSPFYPRGWRTRLGDLDLERALLAGEVSFLRRRRAEWARRFLDSAWGGTRTARLGWLLRDRGLSADLAEAEERLATSRRSPSAEFQARGWLPEYGSNGEVLRDQVDLWARSARQMAEVCRGLGIGFAHFLQPNQYDPGSKPLSDEERKRFYAPDHRYRPWVEAGYPLLRERAVVLRGQGVNVLDTTGLFRDRTETLYKDACCHYNRAGNQIFARTIAAELARIAGG